MGIKLHPNLSAYDDVECLDNFTEKSFKRYCDEKLESTSKHISFIQKKCIDSFWQGKVCEIGAGNSKLLYRLENEKIINEGIGIEISKSRFKFAEKFKSYVKSKIITNLNENIFDILPLEDFDLIIGVDIVLQLISTLNEKAEKKLLDWIKESLRPGGFVIFELWDFKHILKQIDLIKNNLQIWEEFSSNDPFEFILSQINLDKKNDIVWKKIFLKRNSNEKSEFINILRPYSPENISLILEKNGFKSVKIFKKWAEKGDVGQGEYIVSAQKI